MRTTCTSSEIAYFSEEDFNTVVNSDKNTDEDFDVIKALCDYLLENNRIPKDSFVQNIIVLDEPRTGCQLTLE